MKRLRNILSLILPAVMLVSACEGTVTAPDDEAIKGPHVTLTVVLPGSNATKADTKPGEDTWNENKVTSVYYFFYKDGSDTEAPKMSGHFAGLNLSGEGATKTWTIPTSPDIIANQLFPSGVRECQIFVVANPPASLVSTIESNESTITLKELRELTFSTNLVGKQDNFVMVCDDKAEVNSRTGSGTSSAMDVEAGLKRVANKITVKANVAPEFFDKDGGWVKWVPQMNSLKVEFYNGFSKTNLSGDFSKLTVDAENDYFNSGESEFGTAVGIDSYFYAEVSKLVAGDSYTTLSAVPDPVISTSPEMIKVDTTYYKLEQYQQASSTTPFYSYPMEWEFASATEPFLMVELTWARESGSTTYQTCYYKLMLSQKSITTNGWYDVTVDLKVLGSFNKFEPTQQYLYEDYVVLDWENAYGVNQNNVNAEIKDARYLVVSQKEWTVNNKTSVTIPFTSSHPCEVVNKTISTIDYSTGTARTKDPHFTDVDFDLSQPNRLTVTHELYNTLGGDMDCALITIEFDLRHTDNADFKEHIRIVQKPAITIETIANSGGRSSSTGYGYTWVNNARSGNWQIVLGANGSGNNSSIYFTIISVSQFDSSSDYIVGDPRTVDVDNLDKNSSTDGVQWNNVNPVSAPVSYTDDGQIGNRTIKYYYPTVDDGSRDNFIAPSIRVNSANCRSGQNETYENAKQRCASYQEDGYPAGRWRLPTLAECMLIQTMSLNGLVPTIFIQNSTSYYCYAGGWFAGNASSVSDYKPYSAGYSKTTSSGGSGGGAARCVYDEWYWGPIDEAAENNHSTKTFYWGDQPL